LGFFGWVVLGGRGVIPDCMLAYGSCGSPCCTYEVESAK
jgi:hypothetical protein